MILTKPMKRWRRDWFGKKKNGILKKSLFLDKMSKKKFLKTRYGAVAYKTSFYERRPYYRRMKVFNSVSETVRNKENLLGSRPAKSSSFYSLNEFLSKRFSYTLILISKYETRIENLHLFYWVTKLISYRSYDYQRIIILLLDHYKNTNYKNVKEVKLVT